MVSDGQSAKVIDSKEVKDPTQAKSTITPLKLFHDSKDEESPNDVKEIYNIDGGLNEIDASVREQSCDIVDREGGGLNISNDYKDGVGEKNRGLPELKPVKKELQIPSADDSTSASTDVLFARGLEIGSNNDCSLSPVPSIPDSPGLGGRFSTLRRSFDGDSPDNQSDSILLSGVNTLVQTAASRLSSELSSVMLPMLTFGTSTRQQKKTNGNISLRSNSSIPSNPYDPSHYQYDDDDDTSIRNDQRFPQNDESKVKMKGGKLNELLETVQNKLSERSEMHQDSLRENVQIRNDRLSDEKKLLGIVKSTTFEGSDDDTCTECSINSMDYVTNAIKLNLKACDLLSRGKNSEAMKIYKKALKVAKDDLLKINKEIDGDCSIESNSKVEYYAQLLRDKRKGKNNSHKLHDKSDRCVTDNNCQYFKMEPSSLHHVDWSNSATMKKHSKTIATLTQKSSGILKGDELTKKKVAIASTIADTLNNLGVVYEMENNYDMALQSCKEALRVYHDMCGRQIKDKNIKIAKIHDPEVDRTILNIKLMERAKETYADRLGLHARADEKVRQSSLGKYGSSCGVDSSRKKILLREALNIYTDAFEMERDSLGASHPTTARTLQVIGNVRWRLIQDYGATDMNQIDATRDLTQAVESLTIALGPNHPFTASALLDLAALKDLISSSCENSEDKDKYADEALELYKRALKAQQACLGGDHADIGTTLNNIGVLYYSKGDYDFALQAYDEASDIYVSIRNPGEAQHPDASLVWNNVGELHKRLKNWEMASEAFERSLNILKMQCELNNTNNDEMLASTMLSAGEVHVKAGKIDTALMIYQRVYAIQRNLMSTGVVKELDIAVTLDNIADVKELKLQLQGSLECAIAALRIRRKALGDNHISIAKSLLKIGTLQEKMRIPEDAVISFNEALRLFEINNVASNHPLVEESTCKRDNALSNSPEYVRNGYVGNGGTGDNGVQTNSDHTTSIDILADSMMKRGDWDGALEMYRYVLSLRRESLGQSHVDVGITLSNIASIHKKKEEFSESLILYKEALRLYKQNGIAEYHPFVRGVINEISSIM